MDDVLDGNAAAGALSELFAPDMTVSVTVCATCNDERPIGELRAYLRAPGVVLRCASCESVQIRIVRGPRHAWMDLRGVRVLRFDLAAPG
jgi:hypothetical protein